MYWFCTSAMKYRLDCVNQTKRLLVFQVSCGSSIEFILKLSTLAYPLKNPVLQINLHFSFRKLLFFLALNFIRLSTGVLLRK